MTQTENKKSLSGEETQKVRHNLENIQLAIECNIENFDKNFVTPEEFKNHMVEILDLVKCTFEIVKK